MCGGGVWQTVHPAQSQLGDSTLQHMAISAFDTHTKRMDDRPAEPGVNTGPPEASAV